MFIVDDHDLFSAVLMMALRGQGWDAHRGEVRSGTPALLEQADRLRPGLVLLDLKVGSDHAHMDDGQLVEALRARGWTVFILSDRRDDVRLAAAIAAGAAGVVSKSASLEHLVAMVSAAEAGRAVMTDLERAGWLARHRNYQSQQRARTELFERLSPREREVLELLAQGHRACTIAEQFVVSLTTVRSQIRAILAKLEVNSQLEAVALATHRRD